MGTKNGQNWDSILSEIGSWWRHSTAEMRTQERILDKLIEMGWSREIEMKTMALIRYRYLAFPLPPLDPIFRQKIKSYHRPYMWYFFGKPWVWRPLWQSSGVSDMQIHKYTYKYNNQCSQLRNPPMNIKALGTKCIEAQLYWAQPTCQCTSIKDSPHER